MGRLKIIRNRGLLSTEAPSAISMLYPGILTVTVEQAAGTRGASPAGYSGQRAGLHASSTGTTSCLCLPPHMIFLRFF